MITAADIISKLTDVFTKNPESNVGKLCQIMSGQIAKLQTTNERIRLWRDVDQAEGTTLDLTGDNVGQARGAATDEVYRIMIKSKVARNLSTADINTIIRVLSLALGCEYSEIKIEEMYADPIAPEPAGIKLIELPLATLNAAGMSPQQFAQIIKRTVAGGVRVGVIELTGTFEFGNIGDPPDNNAGFADLGQTFGGTLGAAYSPGSSPELPI
ncbi:hypothetical protein FE783_12615 [Paenibacillus mesophilus]|uniref:hypothetical protein n=1 Tax=Paenibacillus mesophilus TaxID=2582849 RepID=UPI00110EBF5A|nr:hypothetical protein [Paenibacillus mesophilus]TMV49352.1 hypothetical protein FE783_12615 [Paenibacillus mesophilus]